MLQDLVVVELASVLAGPSVGMFFAELGAKVIKIENAKTGGDVTRNWRADGETNKISAYYSAVNWNKEVRMLDISSAADKAQALEIISTADVVIANYKPGDAEKLGMDYASLSALKSDLIYASLRGFDAQPDRVAYDVVLQAESGFMHMNGSPTSGPIKMPVAFIDLFAAHQLKEAVLIALLKKEKTGEGSFIETSLERSAIASLANQATNWLMNAHDPQPLGTIHPNIAPYGELFTSKDGHAFVLAVGAESQFAALCDVLELRALKEDPRFRINQQRVKHRHLLAEKLKEAFETMDFSSISIALEKHKVPFGKIKAVSEVLDAQADDAFLTETIEGQETKRLKTVAFNRFW